MADDLPIHERLVIPGSDLSVETMRAGGSGGQHVNTTDSAVRLRLDLDGCAVLRDPVKARLREAFPSRVTQEGEFLVHCQAHRSQRMNLDQAREQLAAMIRDHLRPPPRRKKTRPTRASKRRRLEAKNRRGQVKSLRGRVKDG